MRQSQPARAPDAGTTRNPSLASRRVALSAALFTAVLVVWNTAQATQSGTTTPRTGATHYAQSKGPRIASGFPTPTPVVTSTSPPVCTPY